MKTDVVGYVRVSSVWQVKGDGPDRQEEKIKHFCQTNNLNLLSIFEEAISGTTDGMSRPKFCAALEHGGYTAIVVERADRLARDLMVSEMMLAECRKRGIAVYCTDQGLVNIASNEGDPTRKLIRQIMAALAEWEKSALVAKLSAAKARVKAEKGRCGGGVPYGFSDSREKAILGLMKMWHAGGISYRRIAAMLNEEGFTNRAGNPWSDSSVQSILTKRQCSIK